MKIIKFVEFYTRILKIMNSIGKFRATIRTFLRIFRKSRLVLILGIARSLLNQPIFMNQLFVHGDTGMLRASILCEHFFSVADIWSFQLNDINTTKLQNVKETVNLRGHPLTPSELTLFPGSIVELRKVWIKILTDPLFKYLKWAKPQLHSVTNDSTGTMIHIELASFDIPSIIAPFRVVRSYLFSEASTITVAKLTKHFTVLHCTAKDCIASQFPGIKKWTNNHSVLAPHVWTDTFKLIGDKSISPLARDALAKIVHRTYVPTAARAITLNFRPYMPCGSCSASGCLNPPLYDHEHALLLCPEIMKFWTTVRNLILHISGSCFTSSSGFNRLSVTTIFTLGGCNVNTLHADFEPLMLSSIQNATGLAIATITSIHSKRVFEDVKSKFFTLLGDYLYNTSCVLSATSEADLRIFLKIWNPIFTKTHNGNIFHYDNYKYDPTCQLVGGNL